ncbi:MAG: hypothetical protein UT63_C0002G0035 [Candidatus Gottesmanbacteria bacterium GW2011_GWC2_39_8]|uniref:Lysine biosynthesis protein LysW n=1 Tax=Candidatus Gottesmanbacteria bacterium GW2011_GWC2_39_8 TaxID=1618450 RepID=A0A0G0SI84_9BACT|nr:MAG: hypothetical protein UT63_C0002G0035 [Candidatus Gottesmanbacteria bacterium GW2011_GWC2_39_8]
MEKKTAKCPECDNKIIVDSESKEGTVVECDACGTESEIISVNPLTLTPLEEEK